MERARLSLVLISVCVLSAACAKKAKMRTVPRQASAATAGATSVPSAPPESPDVDTAAAKTPTQVATGPVPAPANPVTPLDDSGISRREARPARVPAPAMRPSLRSGDGELNRPRAVVRRQEPPRQVVVEEDCDEPTSRQRVATRPIARERRRVEPRVERSHQPEIEATDVLHCRWDPTGKPMTYVKYDPATRTAIVQHGWPQVSNKYRQVRLVSGLPPYGDTGVSMLSKGGVPIAHLKATGNGTVWYERGTVYPYESYFGQVLGGPEAESVRGVCWTKSEPAQTFDLSAGGGNN
jgi:hypothetical protein